MLGSSGLGSGLGAGIVTGGQSLNLIEVSSSASVDVQADYLKISIKLFAKCFCDPSITSASVASAQPDATTANAASTNSSASATGVSHKCSPSELQAALLCVEQAIAAQSQSVVSFLNSQRVRHLTSSGIQIVPIFDYGCKYIGGEVTSIGCDYSHPFIIGFEAFEILSFEIGISGSTESFISDLISLGAIVLSIEFVASPNALFLGEFQSTRQAIREAAFNARNVACVLQALNDNSFDCQAADDSGKDSADSYYAPSSGSSLGGANFGKDAHGAPGLGGALSGCSGILGSGIGSMGSPFLLELVFIKCELKEEKKFPAPSFLSAPSTSSSGVGVTSTDSGVSETMHYKPSASGVIVPVEVTCKLIVRIK